MDVDEFNNNYLNILLDKLSKQSKSVFLLADFNVGLFKYNKHTPTNNILDSLFHICFYPILSNQLESVVLSKLLLIIFFSNIHSPSSVLGNVTASSISDHVSQFRMVHDGFLNSSSPKSNIYQRGWNNFDQ